jgi:chemotaxis protein CheX
MSNSVPEALIDAVKETFWTMLMAEVEHRAMTLKAEELTFQGISSIVELAGTLTGSLSLHCPESLAIKATSLLLRQEFSRIGPEVEDTVGELLNMIAGATKRRLSQEQNVFDYSLPRCVTGNEHRVSPPLRSPAMAYPSR